MNMSMRTKQLLLIYSVFTLAFLSVVLLNERGYEDVWILQDILIPTLIYILAFAITAVGLDDNRILAFVCASFTVVMNAIPNLKYQLFYNAFDSAGHYGYIRGLLSLGFVPQTGFYSKYYSAFPGMHIFTSSVSLVFGIDVNMSMKFVTSIIFSVIPLMTYLATNQFLDRNIQKYIIIASSSLSASSYASYAFGGTTFAIPLFYSFFCILFRSHISNNKGNKHAILLFIFAFGIFFSHAVTSIYFIVLLGLTFVLLELVWHYKGHSPEVFVRKTIGIWVFFSVWFVAWLMFNSGFLFSDAVETMRNILVGQTTKAVVPKGFFAIPFLEQLKVLAINHIKDAIIALLALAGLLVLWKKLREKSSLLRSFYLLLASVLMAALFIIVLQFAIGFGGLEYQRFVGYAVLLSPFLSGLFFWWIDQHYRIVRRKSWIRVSIVALTLFTCISLSLIQTFPYQALMPRANVLSSELPSDEYIRDVQIVNTIYQKEVILFAQSVSSKDANITSDEVTRSQIHAFANESFDSRNIWYTPFDLQRTQAQNVSNWSLLLLHYQGKAGSLNEEAKYVTRKAVERIKDTSGNLVYDNGESFIVSRNAFQNIPSS